MRKTFKLILLAAYILLQTSYLVMGQNSISSPYSFFGIGNINENNNLRNKSMGNIGIGTRDYFTVNIKNPASYTAFDSTSFVFEGAVGGKRTSLVTNESTENFSAAYLQHLLFGLPITNWWKSSFGIVPFSGVGYNVLKTESFSDIGRVDYSYIGDGGLNQLFWGNAFRISNNLSVGVNASYLFGTLDQIQRIDFVDSLNILGAQSNNLFTIKDIQLDFGIQYHKSIQDKYSLVVGATFRPAQNLNSERNYLIRSFQGMQDDQPLFLDTTHFDEGLKGKVNMPMGYGAGVSFGKGNNWMVGLDYSFDQWSEYSTFFTSDSLKDSHRFNFGGHFIPDPNSISDYYKRIDYRFGFQYNRSYLNINGEDINGFGITFGAGLPIRNASVRGTRSMINLGIELGNIGTLNNDLIRENYILFHLGVSIYEVWFFKRRYN